MDKTSSLINLSFHLFFLLLDALFPQISLDKFFSSFYFSIKSKLGFYSSDFDEDTIPNEEAEAGSLCRGEAEAVMGKLGLPCSPESEELRDQLGSNEFIGLFDENEPSLEEVKEAFDVFDENRDGFIDAKELQRVLCVLGFKEGSDIGKCKRMIGAFDRNGDERIDFNEFVKFMENTFC